MKNSRKLRILTLIGFLLLFAPFYDSCSDKKGIFVKTYDEKNVDGTAIEKTIYDKAYNIIVDEHSFSGFEIASFFVYGIQEFNSFNDFKIEISKSVQQEDWYKNIGMFISIIFDFIVLISFLLFILSFLKRKNMFIKLSLTNCILVLITLLYIIFLENSFKNWSQIKWGYYVFICTNFLIFYYSKREKVKT